jgi:hypothetical protein
MRFWPVLNGYFVIYKGLTFIQSLIIINFRNATEPVQRTLRQDTLKDQNILPYQQTIRENERRKDQKHHSHKKHRQGLVAIKL